MLLTTKMDAPEVTWLCTVVSPHILAVFRQTPLPPELVLGLIARSRPRAASTGTSCLLIPKLYPYAVLTILLTFLMCLISRILAGKSIFISPAAAVWSNMFSGVGLHASQVLRLASSCSP